MKMSLRYCLAVLLLLPSLSLYAGPVSEAEARQKVQAFLQQRGKKPLSQRVKLMKNHRRTATPASSGAGYYVFNLGETDGFVIVSGDDRTTAILGYADSGSIHEDDMPDGLRYLLEGYEEQIAHIPADAGAPVHRSSRTAIEPLIQTRWNQGSPYNYRCPMIGDMRTVTGCVATSFAQLMYYHKYPTESCALIPAYSTNTQDKDGKKITLDVPELPATTFKWDKMCQGYITVDPETGKRTVVGTDEEQDAVAELMQYCGSSVEMMYGLNGNGGSSAYNEAIPFALKTYFGYDGGVSHAYRKNYSYAGWVDLIYNELAASRPVILGGQAAGGGHSFVCDGYDTNDHADANGDYFHINWGWEGRSDGYYLLSVLQPWEQGIGGSSTLDGFSFGQDVVYGIQPPVGGNADYCMSLEGLHLGGSDATLSSKTYSRTSSTDDFTGISIYYDVWNYYYGSNSFDIALQLQDANGDVVQTFDFCENRTMSWNINYSATVQNIAIPHTVADGTYYVKAMSRLHGGANWQECYDGNAYKMTATISGNELTMTVPIPGNVPPLSVDFQVTGNLRYGSEQAVTVTITGSGAGVYNGDVVLRVNGTAVMGKVVNIAAGESLDLQFSFIPSKAGCNTLTLWSKRSGGSQITGSKSVDITLPLSNNGDNSEAIAQNAGVITDVILDGRTLYKDGGWNTICLPFNVMLSGSVLDGADVRRLSSTEFSNGTLTLNFTDENEVTELEAGKPYIIRWASGENLVSPVFTSVTISNATNNTSTTYVDFIGTTSPFDFTANDNTKLFVGSENKLYYPNADMTLGACRAYFQLKGITAADVSSGARISFEEGNDEVTSLNLTPALSQGEGAWYTLDGRKVANGQKPSQRHTLTERIAKGLYIHHGKKVVK